jgi:hypothetical protein
LPGTDLSAECPERLRALPELNLLIFFIDDSPEGVVGLLFIKAFKLL